MDTTEYIKEIHDLSEFLLASNDVESIEYHIDELYRLKKNLWINTMDLN